MHPGCGSLVNGPHSKCPLHMAEQRKREDASRNKATKALYGSQWKKARAIYLWANSLCVMHLKQGETVAASVVDHIEPHKGDASIFWDRTNWQSLCKPCHDRKTAMHDGGFGNERASAPRAFD